MFGQRIELAPSVTLAAAISAAHGSAAALVWIVPLPAAAKAMITLAVVVSYVYYMARDATLHAPQSIVALEVKQDGRIAALTRKGDWLDCELGASSYVSSRLAIVSLRPLGRRPGLRAVLVNDNVDARDFRRLRTWLRWKGAGDGAHSGEEKI